MNEPNERERELAHKVELVLTRMLGLEPGAAHVVYALTADQLAAYRRELRPAAGLVSARQRRLQTAKHLVRLPMLWAGPDNDNGDAA